jgi:hypothetical protein
MTRGWEAMAKRKGPGRPKGSGGKQPGWKFTAGRKKNLKKARRVNSLARKRIGAGRINDSNRSAYKRAVRQISGGKKGKK